MQASIHMHTQTPDSIVLHSIHMQTLPHGASRMPVPRGSIMRIDTNLGSPQQEVYTPVVVPRWTALSARISLQHLDRALTP